MYCAYAVFTQLYTTKPLILTLVFLKYWGNGESDLHQTKTNGLKKFYSIYENILDFGWTLPLI